MVNAIAVGGYDSTMIDFEVPKKFGLRQSIADTIGIGGLFRALRTIPVLDEVVDPASVQSKVAGINHMAWLLEISKDGEDLYPQIKQLAREKQNEPHPDSVRLEMMLRFGYYITESSEHNAEYHPYFIKRAYPQNIERFQIPLDEYPRRLRRNIGRWQAQRDALLKSEDMTHSTRSLEYASRIMEAMVTMASQDHDYHDSSSPRCRIQS